MARETAFLDSVLKLTTRHRHQLLQGLAAQKLNAARTQDAVTYLLTAGKAVSQSSPRASSAALHHSKPHCTALGEVFVPS